MKFLQSGQQLETARQWTRHILLIIVILGTPFLEWRRISSSAGASIGTTVHVSLESLDHTTLKAKLDFKVEGAYRIHRVTPIALTLQPKTPSDEAKFDMNGMPAVFQFTDEPFTIDIAAGNNPFTGRRQIEWSPSDDLRPGSFVLDGEGIDWTEDGLGLVFENYLARFRGNPDLNVGPVDYWTEFRPGSYNLSNVLYSIMRMLPLMTIKMLIVVALVFAFTHKNFWIHKKPGHCPTCDYDLQGSTKSPGCPECGWNRPTT